MTTRRLVTFTNLFPSSVHPRHGLFVAERMRRVVAALRERIGDLDWQVVTSVPDVPRLLRSRTAKREATMPERETIDGVPVHHPRYRHLPGVSTTAQARRLTDGARAVVTELVRGADRALIDAHYVYPDGVAALRLARELDVPCAVTARGTDLNVLGEQPKVAAQIREVVDAAYRLYAVSDALRERFVAIAGVADDAVELARNGVDLERFRPGDAVAARAAFDLPSTPDHLLVLGVGRLVEGKGFHLAAKALRSFPDAVHLVLVGDGPDRERIAQIAPAGRVHFLGSRAPDEVAMLYRACDLFVLPTEREGWPNVVTEALASGLPVVASAVGGIPQILTSPRVGALVRVGDAKALAAEMRRLLSGHRDVEAIRAFATRFGWDEPVAQLADAYAEVLA